MVLVQSRLTPASADDSRLRLQSGLAALRCAPTGYLVFLAGEREAAGAAAAVRSDPPSVRHPHTATESSLSARLTVGPSLLTPLPQLTFPYCTEMRALHAVQAAASFVSSGRPLSSSRTACIALAPRGAGTSEPTTAAWLTHRDPHLHCTC